MDRYRVNYWLLGTLALGAALLAGAVVGIWWFQMNRNADRFKEEAETALAEGDMAGAANALGQYLSYEPGDHEAAIELASLRIKLADAAVDKRLFNDYAKYMGGVENVLSRYDDADELRRDAVNIYMKVGRVNEAFAHANMLVAKSEDDPDLDLLKKRAQCLVVMQKNDEAVEAFSELVGFDPLTGEFREEGAEDGKAPLAADDPSAYSMLAQLLLLRQELPKEAELVINKLVDVNPDMGTAYLARGHFLPLLASMQRNEAAAKSLRDLSVEDFKRAYDLDPDNQATTLAYIQSLLTQANEALIERGKIVGEGGDLEAVADEPEVKRLTEKYEQLAQQADELADAALKKYPENSSFYEVKARIADSRKDSEGALAQIDRGIDAVEDDSSIGLQILKVDLLLSDQKIDEAKKLIADIRKHPRAGFPGISNQLNLSEARIKMAEGQWFQAKDILEKSRADMPSNTDEQRRQLANIDFFRGLSYEKLGNRDQAIDAYKLALQNNPTNQMAQFGIERLSPRAIGERNLAGKNRSIIAEELSKPVEDRNWDRVLATIDDFAASQGLDVMQTSLLRAEALGRKGDFASARTEIEKLFKENPDSLPIWRSAAALVATDPERGPAEALKVIDKASDPKKFGDLPILRLDRAQMLMAINGEDLEKQLLSLAENTDDWTDQQRAQLLQGLGERFLMIRNFEAGEQMFRNLIKIAPGDLQTRLILFRLALEQSDDEAMQQAQDEILSVVGSKSNPTWMYTEAARLFSRYRRELEEEAVLADVQTLLEKAIAERSEWSDPYLLLGELAYAQKDIEKSMDYLGKGLELGANNPTAALTYVNMLTQRGRYFQARKAVESFDPSLRQRVLGRTYAEILLRTNSPGEALDSAVEVGIASPEDAGTQLWLGTFLQRLSTVGSASQEVRDQATEKAGAALKKVVELAPGAQEGWLGYITYLRGKNDLAAADEAIKQAQLALPEDLQLGVLARAYELVGRWFDAENRYRATYENHPGEPRFSRALAEFYLGPFYQRPDKLYKARPLINEVLQMAADGKIEKDSADALWARRRAAQLLAASQDYQNLLNAEKLLRSNAVDGRLSIEDKLEMARILAPRPEPVSRNKAIALLEDVRPYQDLSLENELKLAMLYFQVGNWPKARDLMNRISANYPEVPEVRQSYIRMLLQRGGRSELTLAAAQLGALIRIAPQAQSTLELIALVADRTGESAKAKAALKQLVPADLSQVPEAQYPLLLRVAQLLTELDDLEGAQKIYEELARLKQDDPRYALELTTFLGSHGQEDKAFEMLGSLRGKAPMPGIIQSGMAIVRAARKTVGDKYDAQVLDWINGELRDDPGSVALLLQKGEFLDLIENYDEAATVYRKLLANRDLAGRPRAVVLNNLAYLLVLGAADEEASGEATKLVAEAVSILGPGAEILDTRGVLEISRGNYRQAADDLALAVTDRPTAAKYFHLVQAHLGAGQNRQAIEAWDKATELGLSADDISTLEQKKYAEVAANIEKIKARSGDL